jgi:signal transduction histidine kinase
MNGTRHLPLVILLFLLSAAGMTMIVGWMMAREEREVAVGQDDQSLNEFASDLREGIDSLEKNFDRSLLDLCRNLEPDASDRRMVALAGTYSGVRQVSVVQSGRLGREARLEKSLEVGEAFPLPVLSEKSLVGIDLEKLKVPGVIYFWANGPRGTLYFVNRQTSRNGRILILGIDDSEVAAIMSKSLKVWAEKAHEELVVEMWSHQLMSPEGEVLVGFGENGGPPEMIYPIPSRMGDWQIQIWKQRVTIVEYRESVMMTAGAIAGGFLVMGVVIFYLLRRSLMVAEQRVSFVNQVSHELRTPMTNIMLNLDLAKDAVDGNVMAGRRLGLMGEELRRLHRLLENVLTFSTSRKGPLEREMERQSLSKVICQVLVQSEPSLKRIGIKGELDLDDDLQVEVDGDALTQILENLFSNVVKYGGEGSELLLRSFLEEGRAVVQVIDSGGGISGRHRERIFKPFSRLSRRVNEGVSGSGLGLAISRDLAHSMGGRLRCLDRPDGKSGSCFELSFPAVETVGEIVPFEIKVS